MDLVDFMILLKNKNIPWNEYTEDEFRLDQIALKDFKNEVLRAAGELDS